MRDWYTDLNLAAFDVLQLVTDNDCFAIVKRPVMYEPKYGLFAYIFNQFKYSLI